MAYPGYAKISEEIGHKILYLPEFWDFQEIIHFLRFSKKRFGDLKFLNFQFLLPRKLTNFDLFQFVDVQENF